MTDPNEPVPQEPVLPEGEASAVPEQPAPAEASVPEGAAPTEPAPAAGEAEAPAAPTAPAAEAPLTAAAASPEPAAAVTSSPARSVLGKQLMREVSEVDLRDAIPAEEREAAEKMDYPLVQEDESAAIPLGVRLRNRRTIVSILVPIGVLLLLVIALPGFQLDKMVTYILQANPWWLLAAVLVYYLGFPLRGYRWALLIRGTGYPLKTKDSTEIIFISWLVNCVVPAKLGDVYRAYLLRVNYLVGLSATFGTVFIERVFDVIAIVVLGLAAGYWSLHERMTDTVRLIFLVGLIIVVVLVVGLLLVRGFGRQLLTRLPFPKRVVGLYDQFEVGMFAMDRRTLPKILITTGLIWATEALRLYFVILAMGFPDIKLGISGAFFVALIASMLTAIPLTPAGLGLVEFGFIGILVQIYDVPRTEALAIAVVDRAISVLSIIVLGAIAYLFSKKTKGGAKVAPPPGDAAAGSAPV
ncbi:MAG: lysylphosphatidylglycerol synthase transmembrane domain-containing protein [Chloroflexota bacterium]